MAKLHEELKQWLISLGNAQVWKGKQYYRCYSGDEEPLDIRVRRRQIAYNPDVIWVHRSDLLLFELAFQEDWRAIAGEVSLAGLYGKVARMYIVTNYEDQKVTNLVSMLGNKYRKEGRMKWGASHVLIEPRLAQAKRTIKTHLKRGPYIWM